jgi:hypothetical protein
MNIHENLKSLVEKERYYTFEILKQLNELDCERLFCELGYSSLFDYCTRELKYSSDQACRRIASARLLRKTPEIAKKVEEGKLTLTHLSKASSLFSKVEMNQSEKIELFSRLEETSNNVCEKIIREIAPILHVQEKIKPVQKNLHEIKFYVDDELLAKIEKIKKIARKNKMDEVLNFLCEKYLTAENKKEEKMQKRQEKIITPTVQGKTTTRYIPVDIKRSVLKRANHRCEFIAANGKRCDGSYKLEYAHLIPYSHGGKTTIENLKMYCKAHNQFDAIQVFGKEKMQTYLWQN